MIENDDDVPADDGADSVSEKTELRPILRDERGRLLKGSATLPGAGRPRGSGARPRAIDIARKLAAEAGITIEDAIAQVFRALFVSAGQGDVQASKLLVERLTANDSEEATAGALQTAQEAAARAKGVEAITGPAGVDFWRAEADSLEQLADERQRMQGLSEEELGTYAAQARGARALSKLCAADVAIAEARAARIEELFGDSPVS
jgi:hypothetical protein